MIQEFPILSSRFVAILRLFLSMQQLDSTSVTILSSQRAGLPLPPLAEVINGCGKSGEWKLSHQTLVPLSQRAGLLWA